MKIMPTWAAINGSMKNISGKVEDFDLSTNSAKVFNQYGFIKIYCSPAKLAEWKEKNCSTEMRWVEIFTHMETKSVPYLELSRLIEFILCLPGTSAPVERLFSVMNQVWGDESGQLLLKTLKSKLMVKTNLSYSCEEFFDVLKNNEELLKKIAGQEKYAFKSVSSSGAASQSTSGSQTTNSTVVSQLPGASTSVSQSTANLSLMSISSEENA